jgi:hypothetical protein
MTAKTDGPIPWTDELSEDQLEAHIRRLNLAHMRRIYHLDGPSGRTRHRNLEETLPSGVERARISGISVPEFPEPTAIPRRE